MQRHCAVGDFLTISPLKCVATERSLLSRQRTPTAVECSLSIRLLICVVMVTHTLSKDLLAQAVVDLQSTTH